MPAKGWQPVEIMSWLAKEQHSRITDDGFATMIAELEADETLRRPTLTSEKSTPL